MRLPKMGTDMWVKMVSLPPTLRMASEFVSRQLAL